MKKLTLIFLVLLCFACSKEGEILDKSNNHILINGKEYYFIKVVPADGERGVWLLVPKDTKVETPGVISYNYTVNCGKNCWTTKTVTSIWIKS